MICSAGGGGFLQTVLKKDVLKEQLNERLINLSQDTDIMFRITNRYSGWMP